MSLAATASSGSVHIESDTLHPLGAVGMTTSPSPKKSSGRSDWTSMSSSTPPVQPTSLPGAVVDGAGTDVEATVDGVVVAGSSVRTFESPSDPTTTRPPMRAVVHAAAASQTRSDAAAAVEH